MKKLLALLACSFVLMASTVEAKGGFSGGGRGGGGFSGGSRGGFSSSSASRPATAPSAPKATTTTASKPSTVASKPATTTTAKTTTTTTTTTSRATVSRVGVGYGGMGMGYGYSNGLLTGILIGNMLHPHGAVIYAGPGAYYNNAMLYPNGQVVNQQGYLVGNYVGGQFTPVNKGPMVAQTVPQEQPTPVVIKQEPSILDVFCMVLFSVLAVFLIFLVIGLFL